MALGAFGAHGLQRITGDAALLKAFETGTEYQLYHALALVATGILGERNPNRLFAWAGYCFIGGIILFSGSLYLLTFLKIQDSTAARFVGPVTPLGGLLFIAGWLLLATGSLKKGK